MAITRSSISTQPYANTGSPDATATAKAISPPGVTRQERVQNQAEVATSSGANASVSTAFIDGDSIKGATKL